MESSDMESLLIVLGVPVLAGAVVGGAVLVVRAVLRAIYPPPVLPPPPSLVLVISASHADFIESLKDKKQIDVSEGEQLYQITRYLWLGSETELSQKRHDINKYSVAQGAESEYNIYLVEIKLKQSDKGFKPNVNQLDRYDAFRKLADLAVDIKVSDRLQIEAYEKLEVYNR
ncbi:hypothetical protein QUB70_00680 [Microcoleus sp. A003_D6]|uniref:hypothetical protein n=1 Tax=Microcoleus sp. A003_D6 TaxID=3055266 RepID=UPI002FD3C4A3